MEALDNISEALQRKREMRSQELNPSKLKEPHIIRT